MDSRHSFPGSSSYLGLLNSQQEGFLHPNFPYGPSHPSVHNGASSIPPFCSQSSQAPTPPEATPVPSKVRRNWSPADDEVLLSAWLNTSKDPIIGNEQKSTSFWKRVGECYADSPHAQQSGVAMEQRHCRQRFHKINDMVNKWCGAFATAERLNSSGQNESDVLKMAHDIFYSDHNLKFNLEHCWCMLRYEQKWLCLNTPKPTHAASKRKTVAAQGSSNNVDEHTNVDEHLIRPEGIKAAKAKRNNVKGKCLAEYTSMCELRKADLEDKKELSNLAILDRLLAKEELTAAEEIVKANIIAKYYK